MSVKFIHTLSDEQPDLQKQIGCMNGIFQLFDRHHFLRGRRQVPGQNNHKNHSSDKNGNSNLELKSASHRTTEKLHMKAVKEKQRISTESSRTSFSSTSCSSSLSSLECTNTASQLEPCLFIQPAVTETHGLDSPVTASFRSCQQSPDLRDVVKDSIYREPRGLSVKTATKGDSGGQTLKYFDSPRPMQQSKSPNPKMSGLKESFQVLHKLQESPRKSSEGRRTSLNSPLKDARRFSCDERESRDAYKSTAKLKELPRRSLDSRAGPMRDSSTGTKSNFHRGDLERRDSNFFNQQEEPESHTRLSNVVAKLMGLDAIPNSMSVNENLTRHIETQPRVENHCFTGSTKTIEENKQNRVPGSLRHLQKEPVSPKLRNIEPVKKPIPNSNFPLEPAPWKHPDGSRSSQPTLKGRIIRPTSPNTSLTVYGEIEKRLTQLEFKQSGKNLRALQQILEAMQKTKEMLETEREAPTSAIRTSSNESLHNNPKSSNLYNSQSESSVRNPTRVSSLPESFKSPIVIMKPAKLLQKASNPTSEKSADRSSDLHGFCTADSADGRKESIEKQTAKDLTPRTNHLREKFRLSSRPTDRSTAARFARPSRAPNEPQYTTRESTNSARSSGSLNSRQQQKTLGIEKQSRVKTPSNSTRTRRQHNGQITESGTPCRKPRLKPSNLQPSDDEFSDVGSDMRDLSLHEDAMSLQSESNISLASQVDEEVSSTDRSYNISHQKQKKSLARSMKDGLVPEPAVASEQPSPVSVLDAAFYSDELPSPIKKKSIALKDYEVDWNQADVDPAFSETDSSPSSAINHKKVEKIQFLIQKHTKKLPGHEENFISASTILDNIKNPDHQYIFEILLASGLLKTESSLTTNNIHRTGYPINPTSFLALELARASTLSSNEKVAGTKTSKSELHTKLHRKLVFDFVNETLIRKVLLESTSKRGLSLKVFDNRLPRELQLWKELCSEVDRLQGHAANCHLDDDEDCLTSTLRADMMHHQSRNWITCISEIPGLVLDIERLIFKDLITEIITEEALGEQVQPTGHSGSSSM